MIRICVFCGSSSGTDPVYDATARQLGALLARRSIGVVYGGGNVGLMGTLADAALEQGGQVIGVIPQALMDRELAHSGLTELWVVDSMHERKRKMHDLADAFVALPGGLGTLEELFETLTWAQLGLHEKATGVVNVKGYYSPMLQMLDHAVQEGLLRREHRAMLLSHDSPEGLLDRLADYQAPTVPKWIDRTEV